ncbi:MAG: SGNH/GDSL hydrolase family protein [Candidatus Aminicenantia bacterium]
MPSLLKKFFIFLIFTYFIFQTLLLGKEYEKFIVKSIHINGKIEIVLYESIEGRLKPIKILTKNFEGYNYDPYVLREKELPCVIWVNRTKNLQFLILYSNGNFKKYALNFTFDVSKPIIEIDRKGRALLFLPSPLGILYTFLEDDLPNFNVLFPFPAFFPSIKKDREENIWIIWSGFDGSDWEIFLTKWDGETFSTIEKITENDAQDMEPSISLEPFSIEWKSYKKRRIFLKSIDSHEKENFIEDEKFSMDFNSFIAFGDSITYGMVDGNPDAEGYVPRLERLIREEYSKDIKVLNRGIPGETTVVGLSRFESVIKQDPSRYVLIMEGTNDVWNYPSWFSALNLEEMIKIAISYNMKPLLANIIPKTGWAEFLNWRIEEINKLLPQIAEKYKIPLVDQYDAFMSYPEEKGGWRALYSGHNHPNEEGYKLMAEVWFEAISKLPRFRDKDIDWRNQKYRKDKVHNGIWFYK